MDSNLQITATVPAGATTGSISVTDADGTGTSLTAFTVTPPPAPSIASFLPTSGPVGTSVAITGSGFIGTTSVTFNGVAGTFSVGSDTSIQATVPSGATTGPIRVTTPGGTATSPSAFTVTGSDRTRHPRSLTLLLRGHLRVRGRLSAADGFDGCVGAMELKIQRRGRRGWRTVASGTTADAGRYHGRISDQMGVFRAFSPRAVVNDGGDVRVRAVSPIRRHRHHA